MSTAYERLLDVLLGHGSTVNDSGCKAQAQCPAHDDGRGSLSISRIEGSVLVYCHAGCETADVLAAVKLTMADLFDNRRDTRYGYPDGRIVVRTPDKRFYQRGDTEGSSLFHADRIGDATMVHVVEGEKDVLAVESVGGVAVCTAMGAGKAARFDWEPLRSRDILVVADRDKPGRKHAAEVVELVRDIAASVSVVEAAAGKDAADHIAAGKRLDELVPVEHSNGAELLDDIGAYLDRFVVYPGAAERHAHVLWIAHTWLMDSWESTPRIAFLSPEPGSGKSRALEVTEPLVPRPVHAVNTTPAYLFRKVADEAGPPTILYDEIDTVFGPKAKDNEEIRGMLNAGHRKGATAGRCVLRGKTVETEELQAYCAVALAGLDDLPDTIMTRSVVVRMRRRAPDETVQPWRLRVNGPEGKKLHDRLAAWSQSCAEKLIGEFWPDMPTGVADRDADVWEALLAVADLAGGHWPTTARKAAVTLVTASRRRAPSIGVLLLRDIKKVFDEAGTDQLPTTRLVAALGALSESPWSSIRKGEPLDARGMAVRLSKYGIGSKAQRAGPEEVFKGYSRAQFTDAWNRYLVGLPDETDDDEPAPPVKGSASVTSVTETTGQVTVRQSVTGGATRSVTGLRDSIEPDLLSSGNGAVTDVTDESGQRGGRPRLCACDRPAPVDFDTGLCQWCTIAASKTGQR